jgi:dCTP deaminase
MGILTSLEVYKRIRAGDLLIEPFEFREEFTPPASIDLRLSSKILRYDFQGQTHILGEEIDEESGSIQEVEGNTWSVPSGKGIVFILHEKVVLSPYIAGVILPRSSLTRLGISLQPTFLNPGYQGNCPILLVNHSDFSIDIPFKNGVSPRIAQVLFWELTTRPHRIYGQGLDEKYQFEEGSPSRFEKDVDMLELIRPLRKALDEI